METVDEALCRTCLSPKTQLLRMEQTVPYLELLTFHDILDFCTNAPATSEQQQFRHPMEFVACPSHICLRCSKALQVTYHFLKMVRNTDVILLEQQQQATVNAEVANKSTKHLPLDAMIDCKDEEQLPEQGEVVDNHSIDVSNLKSPSQQLWDYRNVIESDFKSIKDTNWTESDSSNIKWAAKELPQIPQSMEATNGTFLEHFNNNIISQNFNSCLKTDVTEFLKFNSNEDSNQISPTKFNVIESGFKSIKDTNWTESHSSNVNRAAMEISGIPQSMETANEIYFKYEHNNNIISQDSNSCLKTDVAELQNLNSNEDSNQILSTELKEPSVILCDKNTLNKSPCTHSSECEENPFDIELYNLFEELRQTILHNDENEKTLEEPNMCDNNQEHVEKIDNNLYCDQCDKVFEDMSSYAKHITRHEGIAPIHCELCEYNSCYPESMRKHYKKEHNIDANNEMLHGTKSLKKSDYHVITYKCSQCTKESDQLKEIENHLLTKHQICKNKGSFIIDNYNCPECTRQFRDLRGMRIHYICVHVKKKNEIKTATKFKCEGCEKEFSLQVSLRAHQCICVNPHTFNCKFCPKQLDSFRTYKEHLCSEHTVTKHKCELCGKNFRSSILLSRHTKRHSDRQYQCELCPKNYINYCELQLHISHKHNTKDVQAQCPECGARFASETRLRAHKNKEHLKSLHECGYCSHKSASVASLKLHQYVHSGMPYKCTHCPKQFSLRRFMQKHSKNVHNIELSENDLAEMFQRNMGYPSRYDVFTKGDDYSLDFPEVIEEDLEHELSEFGLSFSDILQDLSNGSTDSIV